MNEISISLSNLAVGHSLLLYAANSSSNNDGGNAVDVNRIVVDVQNCRLAIKFQPSIFGQLETERPLEGSLFDFLKLHEDIARLDVGRVMLSTFPNEFPFSSESLEIEAEGIELVTATLGLVGCTTLPTLLLPFVSVTSNHACAPSAGQGSLSIIVPSIDFGIHPSHMVMADLVLQLYQHEMQPTPPTDHSSFDSLPFGVHLECSALGISILGTTLSSRCLKIEAKGLETTFGVAPVLDGGALRLTDAKLYLLNPSDPQNQIDVFDFGLSEMKNIHAGESAAPYALSRYLSVADSGSEWFEDAASDSMLTAQEGNWLSPTAKFSNKFPTSIVPLVVKSDRLWEEGTFTQGLVPTLLLSLAPLHLDGSWDAGEGGIEAQCQSFGMQIFLAPWQEAVDCFQMYTMFLNGTRYPRDKRTGEERNRMRPDVTASPLSISLRNVSIEVVDHATVARLVARLEVSVRETSEKDSGRVTRVDVAKALLSVGSRADSRAQVDDPHIMPFLGLEGLFARTDAQSLSVSLRHVSCWATPTSVEGIAQLFETVSTSFDAAFQGIRELKAGSHPAGPKETHSEVSTSIQAPFSPFYSHSTPTSAPWENVVTVDLGCVAVLLALDAQQAQSCMWVCDSDSALLVEAVLQDIAFQATGTSCDHGIVAGTASFRLLVDTYDALCRGWEPLVEPCNMGVGFSGLSGSLGRKVSLDIPEGLEITVTRGGVEAVGRMIDVYGPGKDINHDRMKTQGARDVEDVIFNATHNTVEVTLFLDDHAPVHRVKVPPHTQIPLPSRLEDLCLGRQAGVGSRHCGGGRYVGRPDRTSPCGGIVWGNDTQESGMCSLELRGESPHWSCSIPLKPLEGLSRFPYKAKGTTDTNGPVIVDVESTTTNSLIITVRGDVCVRNTAPLDLEVGWSDGGSIHPLDLVLGEGCSSLWLPPSAQAIALRVHKSTGPWVPAISLSFFPLPPCDLVLQGVDDDEEVVHLVVTRSQEQVVTVSSPLIIHSAIPLPSEIWASMPNGGVHAGRILHTRVMPNQKLPVTLFPRLFLKENLKKLCLKLSITPEGYSPCIVTLEDLPRNPLRVCIGSSNERHQKVDVNVSVDHDDVTGNGWIIHISCGFWAFNRLGIPVAVRQSQVQTPTAGAVTEVSPIEVIEVTSGWIQPLSENFNDAAPPKPSPSVQGLGQFLNQFQPPHPPASKSLRAHACKAYPGMLNATMSPLWLQLRTTQSRAPPGRTFWCEPFQVSGHKDHPKDKTVASLLSVPIVNARATPPSLGSYPVLVTVGPVPGAGNGVMGITFSPQYILHNAMDVPILYRQHGNTRSRGKVILPGARCPVTWEDASLPHPRLCFRVEESGWLWSGGVSLASVGDQLVKIRHRDQHRMTMLVRIDIGEEITIQTHRFAPYRIENCSLETLHFRQKSVQEYRDELRPYCSLPYAWDEPGERHLLVVESFGGHFASTFDLDRVGEVVVFGRRHLLIGTVRAEGPLRVLTVVDPALHQVDHGLAPFQSLPPFLPGRKRLTSRIRHRVGVSAGISHGGSPAWSFVLRLTSLGVSLVGNPEKTAKASEKTHRREVARLSLIDVKAQCEAYAVRVKAVLVVGQVQLDTPARDAAFPVALVLPAPFSLTSPLSRIKNAPFKPSILTTPAVSLALSVWTRRPAEVLCIQRAELIVPSVALYLDQKQMEAISNAISSVFPWNPGKHFSVSRATNLPTSQTSLAREKMYLEALQISPVNFTLSFSAFSRFLALADVEDARLRLAGLTLVDRLLSIPTFASVVRQHYMYALLPELFKLLGAVSVIGDPVALVQHLGMGVWSFLSAPAVGLVRSARHRILGHFWVACVNGTRALLVNVAYAVSNAATKAARATRKVVIAWGLGGLNGESIQSVQEIGLPAATARGIVGLLAEPIRGIETRGLGGLLGGIRRGALGAVALPLASALEMAAKTADGVRRRVMELGDLEGQLTWLRPARAMGNGGESILPLRPFDWTESMGRWLLDDVHAGEGETDMGEEYVLCVRCDVETNYLLLTTRRLLYILAHGSRWKADVLWQCALEDVELVRCLGKPDANQASLRVAAHPPRNIPGHLMMFSFLCVTCEQMDAQGMVAMITKSVEQRRLTCLRFVI